MSKAEIEEKYKINFRQSFQKQWPEGKREEEKNKQMAIAKLCVTCKRKKHFLEKMKNTGNNKVIYI